MNPIRTRRAAWRWRWLAVVALGIAGCATGTNNPGDSANAAPAIADPPSRPGIATLLVAMPNAPDFAAVRKSLVSEVQKNFNVITLVITPETKVADLAAAVERSKAVCAVLMNNATLNLYRQYEVAQAGKAVPPAVVVMAAFVEETKAKVKRATGIAYEVPGVTAFVNLRTVVNTPINRVGVVYRPAFHQFIERQKKLAAGERVEIVGVQVGGEVTIDSLRQALRQLTENGKVDAIWMLNDNGLLRDAQFLDQAWKAELANSRVPLIVGLANLIDPASPLGTLAVVPDHEALGLQAANMIFDLADDDWRVEDHPVELPLSVKTIVDVKGVRGSFGLRADALNHIDIARE